ncbi:MAG: acetyl-CoA decarbonylase/synthase complex subunit gamma [bacterium]|nr:acetyl-CoA decarbonylase/synthase complex subunit gamma [bacterium]
MGLTGLDIYKLLPKTNCGECGPPTCLAFAMALAAGKASLETCPHVSEQAKDALGAAAAPPIRLVKVGGLGGAAEVELGDEQVIFRHEKTFYHPTAVAVEVGDDLADAALKEKLNYLKGLTFERVGLSYRIDLVAPTYRSGSPERFGQVAALAADSGLALVLVAEDPAAQARALEAVGGRRPLIYAATLANLDAMAELARKHNSPLAVRGDDLDKTAALAEKLAGLGLKDLVVDSGARAQADVLADLTQVRRLAIKRRFRPLGYPAIAFPRAEDPLAEMMEASLYVGKYASVVVVSHAEREHLLPLLTWRQNVYTDPQKPIQVEPKLYAVGKVTPESPFYVTTNFSLTYYTVEGEVAASKVPAYILPVNTEGTSVLTAWASGKFSAESIAEAIAASGVADQVKHREVILPGYVAVLSGKLEEASGWKVAVGPREASGIPSYIKARVAS